MSGCLFFIELFCSTHRVEDRTNKLVHGAALLQLVVPADGRTIVDGSSGDEGDECDCRDGRETHCELVETMKR